MDMEFGMTWLRCYSRERRSCTYNIMMCRRSASRFGPPRLAIVPVLPMTNKQGTYHEKNQSKDGGRAARELARFIT